MGLSSTSAFTARGGERHVSHIDHAMWATPP
jgi:hypothetical protein